MVLVIKKNLAKVRETSSPLELAGTCVCSCSLPSGTSDNISIYSKEIPQRVMPCIISQLQPCIISQSQSAFICGRILDSFLLLIKWLKSMSQEMKGLDFETGSREGIET